MRIRTGCARQARTGLGWSTETVDDCGSASGDWFAHRGNLLEWQARMLRHRMIHCGLQTLRRRTAICRRALRGGASFFPVGSPLLWLAVVTASCSRQDRYLPSPLDPCGGKRRKRACSGGAKRQSPEFGGSFCSKCGSRPSCCIRCW